MTMESEFRKKLESPAETLKEMEKLAEKKLKKKAGERKHWGAGLPQEEKRKTAEEVAREVEERLRGTEEGWGE